MNNRIITPFDSCYNLDRNVFNIIDSFLDNERLQKSYAYWFVSLGLSVDYNNALVSAVRDNKIYVVENFISQCTLDYVFQGLIKAIENRHLHIVQYLTSTEKKVVTYKNNKAICTASSCGDVNIVQYLVFKGADITVRNNICFSNAVESGCIEVVKYLISLCHDTKSKHDMINVGRTCPIGIASRKGYLDIVKLLLSTTSNQEEKQAMVTAKNNYALRMASENGHLDIVKLLLSSGADIRANSYYAVHVACSHGNIEIVKYLLSLCRTEDEKKRIITLCDNYPIRWASCNGHLEMVKYVVSLGADINADNNRAVEWAYQNGHMEVVRYLVSLGAYLQIVTCGSG